MALVPYKGSAALASDLLGGHIDMMFASPLSMAPPILQGRLRGIAQMGQKRSPVLPDLPTFDEAGIPGYELTTWGGLAVPVFAGYTYQIR